MLCRPRLSGSSHLLSASWSDGSHGRANPAAHKKAQLEQELFVPTPLTGHNVLSLILFALSAGLLAMLAQLMAQIVSVFADAVQADDMPSVAFTTPAVHS